MDPVIKWNLLALIPCALGLILAERAGTRVPRFRKFIRVYGLTLAGFCIIPLVIMLAVYFIPALEEMDFDWLGWWLEYSIVLLLPSLVTGLFIFLLSRPILPGRTRWRLLTLGLVILLALVALQVWLFKKARQHVLFDTTMSQAPPPPMIQLHESPDLQDAP